MDRELLDDLSYLDRKSEFVYVGFWTRLLANFLDLLSFSFLFLFIGLIIAMLGLIIPENLTELIIRVFIVALYILYFPVLESSNEQATFGKRALNIIVVDEQGQRISFSRALCRFLLKFFSWSMFFLGFIMIAFTNKKQGLHDLLSGCMVVRK
ncbi:MAG: RDD family protein [Saprospiraceae bacterium]|nr:RDD family protein [Saprospiraceae bacterium]